MFKKIKELQNSLKEENKELKQLYGFKEAFEKTSNELDQYFINMKEERNILIADLQTKNEELTKENLAVYEENKELRFENEEQKEFIERITKVATANAYNNEKVILSKIKELVRQSNQN